MTDTLYEHPDVVATREPARPRRSRGHRVAAITLIVLGVYLVALPFALSLFSRTRDAEALSDRYRGFATEAGLAQFSANTEQVVDGGEQLLDEGLPGLADDLGMSDAEFAAYVDANYPAVAVYRHRAPEVFGYLTPAVAQTASQAENVSDADDFPVPGVPVTVGPWALIAGGVLVIGAGAWLLVGGRRVATALAVVAGIGLVAAPLVLRWPHETDAAEQVAEAARIAFTPAVAEATVSDTYMTDAAVLELNEAMIPEIGRRLGLTRAEMEAKVARELPAASAVPAGLAEGALTRRPRAVAEPAAVHGRVPQRRRHALPGVALALHRPRRAGADGRRRPQPGRAAALAAGDVEAAQACGARAERGPPGRDLEHRERAGRELPPQLLECGLVSVTGQRRGEVLQAGVVPDHQHRPDRRVDPRRRVRMEAADAP